MTTSDVIISVIKHLPGHHSQLKHAGIEHATTSDSVASIRKVGLRPGSYVIDTNYANGLYATAHHDVAVENLLYRQGRLTAQDRVYVADLDITRDYLEESAEIDGEFEDTVSFIVNETIPPSKIRSIKAMRPSDEFLARQAEVSLDDYIRVMGKKAYSLGDPVYSGFSADYTEKLVAEGSEGAIKRRAAAKNYLEFLVDYDFARKNGKVANFDEYVRKDRRLDEIQRAFAANGFEPIPELDAEYVDLARLHDRAGKSLLAYLQPEE